MLSCSVAENFSDRPIWWHDVVIYVPRKKLIVSDTALLFIGQGHNEPNKYDVARAICYRFIPQSIDTHIAQIVGNDVVNPILFGELMQLIFIKVSLDTAHSCYCLLNNHVALYLENTLPMRKLFLIVIVIIEPSTLMSTLMLQNLSQTINR